MYDLKNIVFRHFMQKSIQEKNQFQCKPRCINRHYITKKMREWNKKQNERNKTWFRFAVTDRKEHKEKIMDKYYTDLKKKKNSK